MSFWTQKKEIHSVLELHYVTWDGMPRVHRLEAGRTRVGRIAENELQIDELSVSAHHCVLDVGEGGVVIRDVDSASGTFVDGEWVDEAPVSAGQTIHLGTFGIEVRESTEASASPPTAPNTKRSGVPARLDDGTYSCQQHQDRRATFECESCFRLSCDACQAPDTPNHSEPSCAACGRPLSRIDWSGLDRTREDVVWDLIPDGVKRAVTLWQRYRDASDRDRPNQDTSGD